MKQTSMPKPTGAELGILGVLWRRGASTVKQVHEDMGGQTGYTTILKLLQNMTEKGLVMRDESQRAHIYQAKHAETDMQRQLLSGLLHKAFRGSIVQLVIQALASQRASPDELAEIKKLIQQLAKEDK